MLAASLVLPERAIGHCTGTTSPSGGRVEWSKADGEEEEWNQPLSAPCLITPVHASLWSWTDVPSVDSCSLEGLLLLSCSSLLLGRATAWGRTFMPPPGKSGQVASHKASWSIGFAPSFRRTYPPAELWGQQPLAAEQWVTPWQGNIFPHGTWSWKRLCLVTACTNTR